MYSGIIRVQDTVNTNEYHNTIYQSRKRKEFMQDPILLSDEIDDRLKEAKQNQRHHRFPAQMTIPKGSKAYYCHYHKSQHKPVAQ